MTNDQMTNGQSQFAIRIPRFLVYNLLLIAILIVGACLRFTGIDWDERQWIHPDEGHMRIITSAIRMPDSLSLYFDTHNSPLNCRNSGQQYSYGTLPLFLTRMTAEWLDSSCGKDSQRIEGKLSTALANLLVEPVPGTLCHPGTFTGAASALVGRMLACLADLGTILLVCLIARRLYGDAVGLLAAALYALTAFSIQQAHFFTVDSAVCFFTTLTIYFSVRAGQSGSWLNFGMAGLATGFAAACKISGAFVSPCVALAAMWWWLERQNSRNPEPSNFPPLLAVIGSLIIAGLLALVAFRIGQPYAFEGPGFFDLKPSPEWFGRLGQIRAEQSGEIDMPWGRQWTDRAPFLFPWINMVVWGMGLPLGLAAWAGWAVVGYELFRGKKGKYVHLILWVWVTLMFLYLGSSWVKSMRYLLSLYPLLVIMAAYLLVRLCRVSARRWRYAGFGIALIVVIGTVLWASAFFSIYLRTNTRVAASRWIFDNVPTGLTVANEHFDWGLPLRVDGHDPFGGMYSGIEMQHYHEDTPEKLANLYDWLDRADYIFIASNRLYASIPRLPPRYPLTIEYYRALFAGELGFELAADFTSRPAIGPFQFPDQENPFPLMETGYVHQTNTIKVDLPPAEEAFSVYDHPRVLIFRKTDAYSRELVEGMLGRIDLARVIQGFSPIQASKAPTGLQFDSETWADRQEGGTWSKVLDPDRGLFDPAGFSNRAPALTWFLLLQCLALLVFPLLAPLLDGLEDNGWLVSKTLGLLLVAWGAWALSSVGLSFNGQTIVLWILALGAASVFSGWYHRKFLARFWNEKKALIAGEELLFFILFILFLQIRLFNPDLWHPYMGGEKPMDFAYLNAVIKSDSFPPYNPWFSGGYINYYYFGFVLVAVLVKLSGIVPHVAYNLAIPTFFALTGAGVFTVTHALVSHFQETGVLSNGLTPVRRKLRAFGYGVWGVVFVCVLGNLGEIRLLFLEAAKLSHIQRLFPLPFISNALKTAHGLFLLLSGKAQLAIGVNRYYWEATRAISHPPQETGPINEFPFFTFLYGDLHAHLLSMPLFMLVLALGVHTFRQASTGHRNRPIYPGRLKKFSDAGILFLLSLSTGALWPTNAWDAPTGLLLTGVALFYAAWNRNNTMRRAFFPALWRFVLVVLLGRALFLPYFFYFKSAYGSFDLWAGSRTPLADYLIIHGLFLFLILSFMLHRIRADRHLYAIARNLRLHLKYFKKRLRLNRLRKAMIRPVSVSITTLILISLTVLPATYLFSIGHGVSGLNLFLCGLTLLLWISPGLERAEKYLLTLILVGSLQSIFVEFFVLTGDVGRMNTVFKFYLQIWSIWGISGAVCLALFREKNRSMVQTNLKCPKKRTNAGLVWTLALYVLLACSFTYTLLATWARCNDRFVPAQMRGLDGRAFMQEAVYLRDGKRIALKHDLRAIIWLQRNIKGSPVILEAVGPSYSWTSRISIHTGLPTIIGWDWHQRQQRAVADPQQVKKRIQDVRQIYSAEDPEKILSLLRKYHVSYIYVGPLETTSYPRKGIDKFKRYDGRYWTSVYRSKEVSIYKLIDPNPA